jgi:ribulose-1,5-bisphosphate 5-phosphatase
MIKAVVFDLDNTLCNTSEAMMLGLKETFEEYAHVFPHVSVEELLEANNRAFEKIYGDESVLSTFKPVLTWMEIFRIVQQQPRVGDIVTLIDSQRRRMLDHLSLYSGVEALLEGLRERGVKVAVLTNGPYVEQGRKLVRLGIANMIDSLVTPDIALVNKPDLAAYECALKQVGVVAEEAVMVGNGVRDDLEGAKAIGMRTVLVTGNGDGAVEDGIVDYVAPDVTAVEQYLQS